MSNECGRRRWIVGARWCILHGDMTLESLRTFPQRYRYATIQYLFVVEAFRVWLAMLSGSLLLFRVFHFDCRWFHSFSTAILFLCFLYYWFLQHRSPNIRSIDSSGIIAIEVMHSNKKRVNNEREREREMGWEMTENEMAHNLWVEIFIWWQLPQWLPADGKTHTMKKLSQMTTKSSYNQTHIVLHDYGGSENVCATTTNCTETAKAVRNGNTDSGR